MFEQSSRTSAPNYYHSFQVLHAGPLRKKTRNLAYSEKHFVLTPYRLLYYDDPQARRLAGCFNLAALEARELVRKATEIRYDPW